MVDPLKHQRLLGAIAAKYVGRGLCYEDLKAEGQFGLLAACRRFDPSLGFSFSTYATPWIHRTISRAIDNQASLIRVPVHVRKMIRHKATSDLVKAGKHALRRHVNERTLESRSDGVNLALIAYDHRTDPVAGPDTTSELAMLMRALSPREAEIIRLRYGLGPDGEMTQIEIGKRLGWTSSRIQQLEAEAMVKLRDRAQLESRRVAG